MRGTQWLTLSTRYGKYELRLQRNVTVLQGGSGTGKSSIWRAVNKYRETEGNVRYL